VRTGAKTLQTAAGAQTAIAAEAPRVGAASKTRWLTVYRIGDLVHPAFLEERNAADAWANFGGNMNVPFFKFLGDGRGLVTRYCVEIEQVSLQGNTLSHHDQKSRPSFFSDYLSCDHDEAGVDYKCDCVGVSDALIAHKHRGFLEEHCMNPANKTILLRESCACSEGAKKFSHRYVGKLSIPFPWAFSGDMGERPIPSWYPLEKDTKKRGACYHFPRESHCGYGPEIGANGCTWKVDPISHTVYFDDLLKAGWDETAYKSDARVIKADGEEWTYTFVPLNVSEHNVQVGLQAFKKLNAEPCGGSLSRARMKTADHQALRQK